MIISKTPFRISLFGGSTDYESFYSKYGSLLVGFAIDKYSYICLRDNPTIFDYQSKISYSKIETIEDNQKIQHNGVRGVLEYLNLMHNRLEISCFNDLPAQTGVGSSSSFIVGLIHAIRHYQKLKPSPKELANSAIHVERKHLKESGGIQDQIWAAYGGLNSIKIAQDGEFHVRPLPVSSDFIQRFIKRCFLVYTGNSRQSFSIASSHDTGSEDENKKNILRLANDGYHAFCNESVDDIGSILRESWESKKRISTLVASTYISDMIDVFYDYGMIGGKLIGSGGSGFIFGITKDEDSTQRIKNTFTKNYINFTISNTGSQIIHG
jgi:D-glycero-alpha-D-manno-heptose-7-phosphate kinase